MIAAATEEIDRSSAQRNRRRRKRPERIEIRLVVELQLPEFMQQKQNSTSFTAHQQEAGSVPIQELDGAVVLVSSPCDLSMSTTQTSTVGRRVPPMTPPSAEPAAIDPPAAPPEVITVSESPEALVDLYRKHLMPGELETNEAKTVHADVARIQRFQDWLDSAESLDLTDTRMTTPRVGYLQRFSESRDLLFRYARVLRRRSSGNSPSTVMQSMNAIMKLCRWCMDSGRLDRLPKHPTKGDLLLMGTHLFQDESEFQGEPVTPDELRQMMDPEVLKGCLWPRLGDVSPSTFWRTVLLSHFVLGFRSQDWFAARTNKKSGLLWSDVITATQCPRLPDLHSPYGWCWYLVHKTKKKSQRSQKPVKLLVPLAKQLRELIELFRGIDPVRVFPLPSNSHSWSREFRGILKRAGLDETARRAAGRPVIQLSEGKRDIASFRKGCSTMWADFCSESAASYMLKHSVPEFPIANGSGAVSNITREHYLQYYRPLREIVPAIETLPIW
jgi:hypothetical protein